MKQDELPKEISLTKDDYSLIQNSLDSAADYDCHKLNSYFKAGALNNTDPKTSYILWLFVKLMDLWYSPTASGKVFSPKYVISEWRSSLPEDFSQNELDFFENIYPDIQNKILKTRIADVLWYMKRNKIEYPRYVIITYLSLKLSRDTFFDNMALYRRALILYLQTKQGKNSVESFKTTIIPFMENEAKEFTSIVLRLAVLLRTNKLYNGHEKEIEALLEQKAVAMAADKKCKNLSLAESYCEEAALWSLLYDKTKKEYVRLKVLQAKTSIHAAEESESRISARMLFEKALKIIRTLSKKERMPFFTDTEEKQLTEKMQEAGKDALPEIKSFTVKTDISDSVKINTELVKGKSKKEVLKIFALNAIYVKYDALKEKAIKIMKKNPFFSSVSKSTFSTDGRVISRSPGVSPGEDIAQNEIELQREIMSEYTNSIRFIVESFIISCLNIINIEHRISEYDLLEIVKKSNVLPADRIGLFVKGLQAGFDFDFITSLHLLVPQIENLIRFQLKIAGIKTTVIDKDGIETEPGASTLMKKKEFYDVFGKDIGFELNALLSDKNGPNLRNNLAHGLLATDDMQSHFSVYFWWFCFKLMYIQFYNPLYK